MKYTTEEILAYKDSCKENPFICEIETIRPVIEFKQRKKRHNKQWPRAPQLKIGENAWRRDSSNIDEDIKKVIGILNKLSEDNFDKLIKEVLDININNQELLKNIVKLIFEKAVSEPNFGEIYSKMCVCFGNFNLEFRKELLLYCQHEFEKEDIYKEVNIQELEIKENQIMDSDEKIYKIKELKIKRSKIKRELVGTMAFIGQLFISQMISEVIIHECIKKLLHDKKEDDIECLCKLFEIVGKAMKSDITEYFSVLHQLSIKKEVYGSRHRFMIKDIIELRQNKWKPRRPPIKKPTNLEKKLKF